MNDPDDLTPEEIEANALQVAEAAKKWEETTKSNKLKGHSLDFFLKRASVGHLGSEEHQEFLAERIAKSNVKGNQAINELAGQSGMGFEEVGSVAQEIVKNAADFELKRAGSLDLSLEDYHATINEIIKNRPAKTVLGSDVDERNYGDALEFRKKYHIKILKRLVARHLGVPEDALSDYDIEKIHYQLTPLPRHVATPPNSGVTELELGFQDIIEQMDTQVTEKVRPQPVPTVAEQVVETASEVKSELTGVLEALQDRAKNALEELTGHAKRNLGALLRKSAQYALDRVEERERTLTEKDLRTLKDLISNSSGTQADIEHMAKVAESIEELEPVVQSLGDAEARLRKIMRAKGIPEDTEVINLTPEQSSKLLLDEDQVGMISDIFGKEEDG